MEKVQVNGEVPSGRLPLGHVCCISGKNRGLRLIIGPGTDRLRCNLITITYHKWKVLRKLTPDSLGCDLR